MATGDLEIEFEDEEEEEEEEDDNRDRRRYRRESLFSVSKEDLILLMLAAFGGILIGWFANKLLNKKEMQVPMPFHGMPCHHPIEEKESTPGTSTTIQEKIHHPHQDKMRKKRGGYFLDREGNAIMESPSISEQWVVKKDFQGNIVDAYKLSGSEWIN